MKTKEENPQLQTIIEQNQTMIKALAIIIQQNEQWNTRNTEAKEKIKKEIKQEEETITNITRKKPRVEQQ